MKVSELPSKLDFGDVIINKSDMSVYTEMIVIWVRKEERDDGKDYDVILVNQFGEIIHIKDIHELDDWEFSHTAFTFGEYKD